MSQKTTIEWTRGNDGTPGATWNPIRGCSMAKGSETGGCLNCYAAAQAVRFAGAGDTMPDGKGPGPFYRFARRTENGPRWTGKVSLVEKHLNDPLHWKTPRRIFVNSMSDLFHESLSFEAIDEVFTVMIAAPQHTYQILTKRAARMLEYFQSGRHDGGIGPDRADYHLDQEIWLGVSTENQKTWDERVRLLERVPASIRFVSLEPQLEHVNCRELLNKGNIHWLVQGGESGPRARLFDLAWARDVRDDCSQTGTRYFFKQAGANVFDSSLTASGRSELVEYFDSKGGNSDEWEIGLRVREFPEPRAVSR